MKWFHSCRDDDAFALQFGVAHGARISRAVSAMKLRQLGEDRLLDQLLRRLPFGKTVAVGAGDDCALVAPPVRRSFLVLKTDCVVEGIHLLRRENAPYVRW